MSTCLSSVARKHKWAFCCAATVMVAMTALMGCSPSEDASEHVSGKQSGADASVLIDSVNYMHERGVQYTLYDLAKTPAAPIGGSIVMMLATGGEKGCCLSLPRIWRPGIKVRLAWQESDRQRTYPEKYARDLEIPRYTTPADLYVVFSAPHEVELVVSQAEPGHPDWQGSIKKPPWEQCVQTYGRKPCFAALPKMFDTASSRGECKYMKEHDFPNAENLCTFALAECMRDFEDEPFCKDLLWSTRER